MTVILAALAAWFASAQLELDPPAAVLFAAVAALAWSTFAACFWPFTACPAPLCDRGRVRRPGKRKAYRRCGWCGGKGERVRWARRLYDEVRPSKHGRRR